MAVTKTERIVRDVVDGEGLYFSRLAAGGPFAFLASVAVEESGEAAAPVDSPYAHCPPAHVVTQTRYIFEQYKQALESLGSSINEVLQVEQFIPHKNLADGYLDTSRGRGFMERGRPASALLCTGDLAPEGCVINPTAIAVIPNDDVKKEIPPSTAGYHESLTQPQFGDTYAEEGPYNEVVTAGPYVFTVGDVANEYENGTVAPEARVPDWIWWGSEIRNETEFCMNRLETFLDRVGATLEDVIHTTIYLSDFSDLYEFDRVWRKRFPNDPPARTVVPVRGLGQPRLEAPGLGHRDNAVKMEHLTQSIRPGFGASKEVVSTGAEQLEHQSEAIKAGSLLWISSQLAGGRNGLETAPDARAQLDHLFDRLDQICQAGGTSLDNLLRVRAFVTDVKDSYDVYAALKQAVPSDPPSVLISGVPGPLQIPGCTVVLDAVAHVPD